MIQFSLGPGGYLESEGFRAVSGKKGKWKVQVTFLLLVFFSFMLRYSVCQGLACGVLNPIGKSGK